MALTFLKTEWLSSGDGFRLYPLPLSEILKDLGIFDTGISDKNPRDVDSYYDDWHLFAIDGSDTTFGLLKLREQEQDHIPGFSDKDDPCVTISFIPFPIAALEALAEEPNSEAVDRFVDAFRRVTEYAGQRHSPELRAYFRQTAAKAPYLIAECYMKKLLSLHPDGIIPFPENAHSLSRRLTLGLEERNKIAKRNICDWEARCLRIADPAHPTQTEKQCILALHTGNLSINSFAAEVKFHADALTSWENRIPVLGQQKWYASAIRADMQLEEESFLRERFFSPYHDMNSQLVKEQETIHGKQ